MQRVLLQIAIRTLGTDPPIFINFTVGARGCAPLTLFHTRHALPYALLSRELRPMADSIDNYTRLQLTITQFYDPL